MPENPLDFDLKSLVIDLLHASDDPNPRNVSFQVFEAIPEKYRAAALMEALGPYVRIMAHRDRPGMRQKQSIESLYDASPSPTMAALRKDSAFRAMYVGAGGKWKFLGDFTIDDLDHQIQAIARRVKSAQNQHNRFLKLKELLESSKKLAVKELPYSEVISILEEV